MFTKNFLELAKGDAGIVGGKGTTKILKDGDIIEVDVDNGVVGVLDCIKRLK